MNRFEPLRCIENNRDLNEDLALQMQKDLPSWQVRNHEKIALQLQFLALLVRTILLPQPSSPAPAPTPNGTYHACKTASRSLDALSLDGLNALCIQLTPS